MNKCAVILLLAGLAPAQTTVPYNAPGTIAYEFKNVDINRAMEIVNFVGQLLNNRVMIQVNGPFKTAIIRPNGSNMEGDVAKAEELLKRYDVAPPASAAAPQIDFVAYLVRASNGAARGAARPGQPIPPVLQEAVAEMKKTFAYTDYTLIDTVETVVRHHSEIEDILPGSGGAGITPCFYQIIYDTSVSTDRKTVSIDPFKFTVRIPVPEGANTPKFENSGISTFVSIREGQKLVIGKLRAGDSDPFDIFLILTMKLL